VNARISANSVIIWKYYRKGLFFLFKSGYILDKVISSKGVLLAIYIKIANISLKDAKKNVY